MTSPIWLFDLDDTLHNASAHIFPEMNQAMTRYIMSHLDLNEHEAHQLRQHYWHVYGATLKGLVRHHGIDATHFLEETHALMDLPNMVIQVKRLKHVLRLLPGRKCVFTNAPKSYALRVLDLMGLNQCFELIFSVESTKFHAKPSVRGFSMLLDTLHIHPKSCIMIEDSLPTLMTAKRLGMRTVWVTNQLSKPNFVNYRLSSVLALRHLKL